MLPSSLKDTTCRRKRRGPLAESGGAQSVRPEDVVAEQVQTNVAWTAKVTGFAGSKGCVTWATRSSSSVRTGSAINAFQISS